MMGRWSCARGSTVSLIAAGVAGCGGGGSPITDLAEVRSKLAAAAISCPKEPTPYKKAKDELSLGIADPATELKCTTDGISLTATQWTNAADAKAAFAVVKSFACGFGISEVAIIEGGNWGLDAEDPDSDSDVPTSKEHAALTKASKALGIEPTIHKCDKSASGDDNAASSDTESTTEESSVPTTTVATRGDRSKPLAVGESAKVGDYEVTVDSITPNATSQVQAANEFNDPPSKGQYADVSFTATYQGTDEGSPAMDLSVVLSGSDKVQYPNFDCMATVNTDDSTIEPGGKVQVTVCIDAPADAIAGGLIFLEPTASFDNTDRAYWKVP